MVIGGGGDLNQKWVQKDVIVGRLNGGGDD